MAKAQPNSPPAVPIGVDWIALVKEKVENLRYGVVQIIVHDGRVIQIERTEKTRLPSKSEAPSAE